MKKLYLCRHGETEWTLSGQHTGITDIPLTAKGKQQAVSLRRQMEKVPFDAIFCSPMKRVLDTCGDLPHQIDPGIAEWDYGNYEGKTSGEIHKRNPNWNIFKDGAPGGETPEQVGKRADAFLRKVKEFPGNVAIFSHGHFLRVVTARYLGLAPEMGKLFLLSVASLGILGDDRGEAVIILWNHVF